MKLGMSAWRLRGQRTGIGRYIVGILEQLTPAVRRGMFDEINVYTPHALATSDVELPPGVRNEVLQSRLPMLIWESLRLGPSSRDDVVFYPSYSRPPVARHATVVTIHDATMRMLPHMFTRRDRLLYGPLYGWSGRHATIVITTSEAGKRDIAREWDVDPDKIRVTPLAAAGHFAPLGPDEDTGKMRRELLGADVPYFMFAGKISGRRNLPQLLTAFAKFKEGRSPHKLVMVGPAHAAEAAAAMAAECGVGADFITFSYVTDDVLNKLYNCAQAFIMPSVYENVSFPVLEAQACGTPVICVSTDGALEMTGGEALLIPKLETPALVEAMNRIAGDEPLRIDLSRRGLENSSRFSWTRCARETLEACAEAVEIHGG